MPALSGTWMGSYRSRGGGCFDIIRSDPDHRLIRGGSGLLIRPGAGLKRGGRYFGDRDSELCPRYARGGGGGGLTSEPHQRLLRASSSISA